MVFPKMNFSGYHAECGRQVQGYGEIAPSTGTSEEVIDHKVGGRYGGASVTMDREFGSNFSKYKYFPNPIPEDKTINLTWSIILQ